MHYHNDNNTGDLLPHGALPDYRQGVRGFIPISKLITKHNHKVAMSHAQ